MKRFLIVAVVFCFLFHHHHRKACACNYASCGGQAVASFDPGYVYGNSFGQFDASVPVTTYYAPQRLFLASPQYASCGSGGASYGQQVLIERQNRNFVEVDRRRAFRPRNRADVVVNAPGAHVSVGRFGRVHIN